MLRELQRNLKNDKRECNRKIEKISKMVYAEIKTHY